MALPPIKGSRVTTSKSIVWKSDMKLGSGGPHDSGVQSRISRPAKDPVGEGTVKSPRVIWVRGSIANKGYTKEQISMIEQILMILAGKWAQKDGKRDMVNDDKHVTVRMGTNPDICNVHGHIYLKEDIDTATKASFMRLMRDSERKVVGGKGFELWVWGYYPPATEQGYERASFTHPTPPLALKPGRTWEENS
ncbi:hypothetical protein SUNI508_12786 [Seiridium unicorne]|uniref:Uncharacterized protein n=1 Tax=Seiridium unicorne TaxID=138068 RepID=A0ABR2VH04_9PEZI